jgi:sialic acid synthase SpsE
MKKNILIAELCQNHNGDLNLMLEMVHAAKEAGCSVAKIQDIKSDELNFRARFEKKNGKSLFRPYEIEKKRLKLLDLPDTFLQMFVEECRKVKIKSMVTPFTLNSIERIKDINFDLIKIASYDCSSFEFLKKITKINKQLIVSTGATTQHEIVKASKILKNSNFSFLHCVTIYPTPLSLCNFKKIRILKKFTKTVGWSDHSRFDENGHIPSLIALTEGADIIERHFTILDKSKTKDGVVSINYEEAKKLVKYMKKNKSELESILLQTLPNWRDYIGNGSFDLSKQELLNRDYYKGRFK